MRPREPIIKLVSEREYLTNEPPPARTPRPADPSMALRGKRVVLIHPDGYLYDWRAAGNLVQGPIPGVTEAGDRRYWAPVVPEHSWYECQFTGAPLPVQWWPVTSWPAPSGRFNVLVYVE